MIQTEVKSLGNNEHLVHVTVAQSEYDRIYADQMKKLTTQAKLPGFRPGKTPNNVIKKQFGSKLHEDTISELLQAHYVTAIESSGLTPAVQPNLDIPATQPAEGFEFTMKVTTWPKVEVKGLNKLSFDETAVEVEDQDIDQVIERLEKSQVKFEIEAGRAAENGDQLHIDFVGSIDGEEFAGGKGEDVPLVLGEGRFIPGFEEQLVGKKAGDDVAIEVTFPENYQAAHLAGKAATFASTVKSVGKPVNAENEDDLAKMLGFEDGAALREDARVRLSEEADYASFETTREAALDALLEANPVDLPEALIAQDIRETTQRVLQNMKQQGVEVTPDMLDNDEFRQEVRERSERGLKLSVLIQAVREAAGITLDEALVDAELDRQSMQYPEAQRDQFKNYIKEQKEQMAAIRDRLLERQCVEHIVSKAKTKSVTKPLSVWQAEQEQ
ncbi:trigger factor [Mariprofundus ferrinatatus]|uniref:Trigger factor n=1 Tax=Mariprofundus ferrinatatus TaxID=1921087 RepID=A0A2K8L578_9PROT|nr:trigger factor [Mariprofundus ferrinatatus]ATX81399.1 trigger factor [Mariprofundus ferrinatatus]